MNFLYLFDVWASDPTQTLAKRGTCDVTTCSSLHLQPVTICTCILFETKAFAGDPHVPWSAFAWQLDERLLVLFFKSGDFDWEHQNVFELDCSFLAVSSQKLAIVLPSLKHGHDSWSRLRTSPICESLVECFLMQRRAERGFRVLVLEGTWKIYNNSWLGVAKLTNMQACVRHCEGLLGIERQVGIAESNLQMCEETKHIRDVQRNQMGVGLCLQQLICPSFFHCEGCAY